MPISGNSSYPETISEVAGHWRLASERYAPQALVVQLPDKTTVSLAQFEALRTAVRARQLDVQEKLMDEGIARGRINLKKEALLKQLGLFNAKLDAYYQGTEFYGARPPMPGVGEGETNFLRPLRNAVTLWARLNASPAPPGVTLPLVLADGTDQVTFDGGVKALRDYYDAELLAAQDTTVARGARDLVQERSYQTMKFYRMTVPAVLAHFPDVVEALPRLTPLPGHTPKPVLAAATFQPPTHTRVEHSASDDKDLKCYQLRGTAGDKYDERDAVVIATHGPDGPLEFVTDFGLDRPGARVTFKVFVILKTGNECGSAPVTVTRPAATAQGTG